MSTEPPPRRRAALVADTGPLRRSRDFRLLFVGQGVSMFGTMLSYVAVPYQVYAISRSSLLVGVLSLAEVLPVLVVGFLGGALADAFDRRRLVLVADAGLGACSVALAANTLLGARLWPLFVLAPVAGVLGSLQRPALDAMLPRVVTAGDVPAATALRSVCSTAGQVGGPALAGVLIAAAGTTTVYAADVATYAVSLLALWGMAAVPPPDGAAPVSRARLAEGFRYARSRQDLLGTYVVDMAAMTFGMPEALFPQLATRLGGAQVLGLLFAAPALGSFLVSVTAGWAALVSRKGRAVVLAAGAWGLAVVVLGVAPGLAVALTALVVAGGLDMVSGLMRSTIWNESIPDSLRGRLAGIELVSFSSGPSIGNFEGGLVEALGGLRFSIVSGGLACVASTVALAVALPGLWRYESSPPAGP